MLSVAEHLLNLLPILTGWLEKRIQAKKEDIKKLDKDKKMQ